MQCNSAASNHQGGGGIRWVSHGIPCTTGSQGLKVVIFVLWWYTPAVYTVYIYIYICTYHYGYLSILSMYMILYILHKCDIIIHTLESLQYFTNLNCFGNCVDIFVYSGDIHCTYRSDCHYPTIRCIRGDSLWKVGIPTTVFPKDISAHSMKLCVSTIHWLPMKKNSNHVHLECFGVADNFGIIPKLQGWTPTFSILRTPTPFWLGSSRASHIASRSHWINIHGKMRLGFNQGPDVSLQ